MASGPHLWQFSWKNDRYRYFLYFFYIGITEFVWVEENWMILVSVMIGISVFVLVKWKFPYRSITNYRCLTAFDYWTFILPSSAQVQQQLRSAGLRLALLSISYHPPNQPPKIVVLHGLEAKSTIDHLVKVLEQAQPSSSSSLALLADIGFNISVRPAPHPSTHPPNHPGK